MSDFLPLSQIPPQDTQFSARIKKLERTASGLGKNKAADKKLMKAAKEFESLLTFTMLKQMRQALPKSDLLKSSAQGIYQSMLDQEITKAAVKHKGMGIAEMIYRQFSKNGPNIEYNTNEKIGPSDVKNSSR